MRRRKSGASGSPAWVVTFADLLAAVLAFFVMMAAYSSIDKKKLQIIAGSMRDAFGTQRDVRLSGLVERDGIPTRPHIENARVTDPRHATDLTGPNEHRRDAGLSRPQLDRGFALAAASLRQALRDMPEIAELSKNILVEVSDEGLDIQLVDHDGREMFGAGSTVPTESLHKVLHAVAPVLRRLPNRIALTGHTAPPRPGTAALGDPWALSIGRAAAVRALLSAAGVPEERFAVVAGKADTEPLIADNPYLPFNRRVGILLKPAAAPLSGSAAP